MDPIIGGAIIGGVSNLVGNLFGSSSTKSTNKTNLKIAQMNNEWSERMMQKQMDYNTDMWNKQNEYNDPSKQVERLTKAGINPALALSNISTGSAQGASSPSLPSPTGATMQSFRPDFSGIGGAMQTMAQQMLQRDKQAAEIRYIDKQSDWYDAQAKAQISKAYAETDSHTAKTYYQRIMNQWAPKQFSADWMNKIRTGWQIEEQTLNLARQGFLLDKDIASYDTRLNGDLSEQLSRIALNFANGELSLRQADKALSETWTDIEKRIGMKIDNEIKSRTKEQVINRAHQPQNSYQLGWDGMLGANKALSDFGNWMVKDLSKSKLLKWSKRAWKDTKRSFGLYW